MTLPTGVLKYWGIGVLGYWSIGLGVLADLKPTGFQPQESSSKAIRPDAEGGRGYYTFDVCY
jgi:hypothetical protein